MVKSSEEEFRQSLIQFQNESSSRSNTPTAQSSWLPTSFSQVSSSVTRSVTNLQSSIGIGQQSARDDEWIQLTRTQRLVGFILCLGAAMLCFMLAMFTLPTVILFPQKFTLTYTFGSILSIAAFALLRGPKAFFTHLISPERRVFTACYFGSMLLTLYAVFGVKNYIFIIICALIQLVAIIWYYVSYLPGGTSGLSWITRSFVRSASGATIPI